MIILGVDPGIKHTGWAVLQGSRPLAVGTLVPAIKGRLLPSEVLAFVLPAITELISKYTPSVTVVEEVTWYGRARRAMLPLAHVAGGIAGMSSALGVPTFLLLAAMRNKTRKWPDKWSEHERDAARLAYRMHELFAGTATAASVLPRRCLGGIPILVTTTAKRKRS